MSIRKTKEKGDGEEEDKQRFVVDNFCAGVHLVFYKRSFRWYDTPNQWKHIRSRAIYSSIPCVYGRSTSHDIHRANYFNCTLVTTQNNI